jgi:DNA-binding IclR family transcriptional regulator
MTHDLSVSEKLAAQLGVRLKASHCVILDLMASTDRPLMNIEISEITGYSKSRVREAISRFRHLGIIGETHGDRRVRLCPTP